MSHTLALIPLQFILLHYNVFPTSADSSHQNGPVERAHRTVGDTVRALLTGANLDIKFWPYAFYHMLQISNSLPERGTDESLLFLAIHLSLYLWLLNLGPPTRPLLC